MDAKTLRIGNVIVIDTEDLVVVKGVINRTIYFEGGFAPSRDFKELPITEEVLKLIGATKTFDTHHASFHFGSEKKPTYKNLRLEYVRLFDRETCEINQEGYFALYISNKFWKHLFYLHELQNIVFDLTDQEIDVSNLITTLNNDNKTN